MTKVKIYADDSRATVVERITAKTRNEFISAINSLKDKYKNFNAGCIPIWVQVDSTIIPDASLSNLFETARLMQKGIL
jgi:hypothetical protein